MERVAEFSAVVVGGVIAIAFLVLFIGGGFQYRDVCFRPTDDLAPDGSRFADVATGEWRFSPLAALQETADDFVVEPEEFDEFKDAEDLTSEDVVCVTETRGQWVAGQIPVVGEFLESLIGGPEQGHPYYDVN